MSDSAVASGIDREFSGKRVLVTGGTQGAGAAIVRRFAAAGARTISAARKPPPGGTPGHFVPADLRTAEGVDTLARGGLDVYGGVDVLVHDLGGSSAPAGGYRALDDEMWLDALSLNLLAAVRLDRARCLR